MGEVPNVFKYVDSECTFQKYLETLCTANAGYPIANYVMI
jgi:hypothetical protein